jgi:RNA polymerase sigma-70 factor (ECF subfamily)
MDERALIRSAQRGDLDHFNELVLKYQSLLHGIAIRMLPDGDTAADVVQEAFLSAFRNLKSFHGESLRGWLVRITINACYDEFRRQSRRAIHPLEMITNDGNELDSNEWLADDSPSPEYRIQTNELERTVHAAMQILPPPYRTVAVLVDVEGFTYDEAAKLLGLPVGTIKSRLARARSQLRRALGNIEDLLPIECHFNIPARSCL